MQLRLDSYLFTSKKVKSRTFAAEIIKIGGVTVNGTVCTKPSFAVSEADDIVITADKPKFVGRGGLKLEAALLHYGISLENKVCIDVGASTGGFTDCMLQSGAKMVYAVDVGVNQLDDSLKNDSKVISLEKTDIRNAEDLLSKADFICVDVSFISLKLVLPSVFSLLLPLGGCVALIKPQFEAGKANLNKKGVVKDEKIRRKVCKDISDFAASLGFICGDVITSPIKGGEGNEEYLIFLQKPKAGEKSI